MKSIAVAFALSTSAWLSVLGCSSGDTTDSQDPVSGPGDAPAADDLLRLGNWWKRRGTGGMAHGTGGTKASGGSSGSGASANGSGGRTSGNGGTANGGTTSGAGGGTGGGTATNGSGGATGTGGAMNGSGATGGVVGTGGAIATGGAIGAGGAIGTGGAVGSGGRTSGTGGAVGSGGKTSGTGGATSGTGGTGGATNGGAYVRQFTESSQVGIGSQDISSTLSKPVLAGSTILVFATEYNIGGTPAGSAPPDPIQVDDSLGGKYTYLQTINSQADWQAVMSYARYNVGAGNMTVHAHFAGLEWQGIIGVEIANVSASPLIASTAKFTASAAAGANAVTSGAMAAGSSPALVVALGVSTSSQNGPPTAGTGFTAVGKAWNWNGAEGTALLPSALLEYGKFNSPGNVAATFTAAAANDNIGVLAMALRD